MANERITGKLGLSIPDQKFSSKNPAMSLEEIIKWRDALPMADTGAAAKNMFLMLSNLNHTVVDPEERIEILDAIRVPLRTITKKLKSHYIEQSEPLTEQKLKIASLREALITAMADNYKLSLEGLVNANINNKGTIATAICRVLYYDNLILLCRYQLYDYVPTGLWTEIHILYKYSKARGLLDTLVIYEANNPVETTPLFAYIRIILMNATDPYQWRQKDQYSINKAIALWTLYPSIYEHNNIPDKKEGVYIIDLDTDEPPLSFSFRDEAITKSCIALALDKEVEHLQEIIKKINKNELQAKIEHPGDPEFSVTISALEKLIRIWSKKMNRDTARFPLAANINIAFGLNAAHYYLNGEVEFDPTPENLHIDDIATAKTNEGKASVEELPTFDVDDDEGEEEGEAEDKDVYENAVSAKKDQPKEEKLELAEDTESTDISKKSLYKVYEYNVENISPTGICLSISDKNCPPFQAGEIIVFKNPMGDDASWSVGALRWIKRPMEEKYLLGVELISPYAEPAGMQVIRNGRPVGHLLRCIVLPEMLDLNKPSMIITPGIPLHSNKVMLYIQGEGGIVTTITKEVEDSGKFYRYEYTSDKNIKIKKRLDPATTKKAPELQNKKIDTEFDSIWGDL